MGKKPMKKTAEPKKETGPKLKTGNLKVKGTNHYHDKAQVQRLNMLKGGKAVRDKNGKVLQAAAFQERKAPVARVQPDRRWFGNTRVIGQGELERFRAELGAKRHDPYQVLLRQSKLPMSLLEDRQKAGKLHLLKSESFGHTFGPGAQRKRPKLAVNSMDELAEKASTAEVKETVETEELVKDPLLTKGQSKRIWGELYKVIDASDVLVHVLDARDPLGTRCRSVETFLRKEAPHKHLVFLMNKCDLVPPRITSRWVKLISKDAPCVAFHANMKNPFGKGTLMQLLRQYSRLHRDKRQISVGFIGYPNTGKSSIINTLRQKAVCPVAPIPGQTKVWQYVTLMKRIYLIDCPGVVPPSASFTGPSADTDIVLRGVVRIENVQSPEDHISALLERVRPEHLGRTYDIWKWADAEDFLAQLAVKSGKLLKAGEPDMSTAAKMILNDWLRGRIPYYVAPPVEEDVPDDEVEAENDEVEAENDEEVSAASEENEKEELN